MAVNVGKLPDRCANPDCGRQSGFAFRSAGSQHDAWRELGTLQAQQILLIFKSCLIV